LEPPKGLKLVLVDLDADPHRRWLQIAFSMPAALFRPEHEDGRFDFYFRILYRLLMRLIFCR
jgi:hypothetical protein